MHDLLDIAIQTALETFHAKSWTENSCVELSESTRFKNGSEKNDVILMSVFMFWLGKRETV